VFKTSHQNGEHHELKKTSHFFENVTEIKYLRNDEKFKITFTKKLRTDEIREKLATIHLRIS
jgi:hypothetical protein